MPNGELWKFQLLGTIDWRLKDKTPREIPVGPAPGWSLLTPYAMLQSSFCFSEVTRVNRLPDGDLVVTTDGITLRAAGMSEEDRERTGSQAFAKTLQALRYLSRQFFVPERFAAQSFADPAGCRAVDAPEELDAEALIARDYWIPTAVTQEHLDQVAALPPEFSPPASVMVMLDALQALLEQDFRKALLYGAIAIESLASTRLAEAYDRVKAAPPDPRFRVIDIPIAGGRVARKDPIYESLGEDNFPRMLHERPLYLLGRSLMVEDAATFTNAQKLRNTRNKLAHIGEVPANTETFELSARGATAGLATAISVLKWFGDAGPYFAGLKFVRIRDGKLVHEG
jgi:hypothetical protein